MKVSLPTRLSESVLWNLQRDAYFDFGIKSWTQKGVPFHITNNSLIAKQYAEIVFPFFERGPITFLEIGAGSGKFAYLFLIELLALGAAEKSIRYLLTDLSEKNVAFFQNHPLFAPWIKKGIIVPLVYDPLTPQPLPVLPDVVIANYFFDAIPQDLFRKEKGEIEEGLVTVTSKEGLSAPDAIAKLVLDYCYKPIDLKSLPYFDLIELDELLRLYEKKIEDGPFLFPSSGIKALYNLAAICKPNFTLLTADWGKPADEPPQINLHGTFSFPVDFRALAQFFIKRQGEAFINSQGSSRFAVALFSTDQIPEISSQIFKYQHFAPLQKSGSSLKESLPQANWDATFFFSCFESFEAFFEQAAEEERVLFIEGCLKIQPRFYPLFREEARLLDRLGLFLESIHQKKEAEVLFAAAKLFINMPQHDNDLAVLQIGQPHLKGLFPQLNPTLAPLDLTALESLGMFDLILFFPQYEEKPEETKIGLIQEIEEKFPHLKELVYTDADLHQFLAQLDTSHPKYTLEFFLQLQRSGQISFPQLEMVFDHLEKQKIISVEERAQLKSCRNGVDYFEVLLCALKYHMKQGGMLKGAFPLFFQDDRFFNEIVVDPYLDYKEEVCVAPSGEKFSCVTIQKLFSV